MIIWLIVPTFIDDRELFHYIIKNVTEYKKNGYNY